MWFLVWPPEAENFQDFDVRMVFFIREINGFTWYIGKNFPCGANQTCWFRYKFSFCSKFLKQNPKKFRLRRYFIFQYVVKLRAAGGIFFQIKGTTFTKNDRKSAEISPHKKAPPLLAQDFQQGGAFLCGF